MHSFGIFFLLHLFTIYEWESQPVSRKKQFLMLNWNRERDRVAIISNHKLADITDFKLLCVRVLYMSTNFNYPKSE